LINRSFSQDLFPRFPSCQFIDQFIQKADFLHQRIFDFFHPYTTSMINAVWGCNAGACKKKVSKKILLFKLPSSPLVYNRSAS